MRLLFDQNLSPRLVNRLTLLYPNSTHASLIGFDHASDEVIWAYARENGFTLVTKDADFNDLSVLLGFPPKVIWIRQGNCTMEAIEIMLRSKGETIRAFQEDRTRRILILY